MDRSENLLFPRSFLRSRTHSAKRAASASKTRAETYREDSESEVEESPRKRTKTEINKATPKKGRASASRKLTKRRQTNAKVNRRKRCVFVMDFGCRKVVYVHFLGVNLFHSKHDSDESESSEVTESDDDEYVAKTTPDPNASSRRSSRSAVRSKGSSLSITPSNKALPAVVLKRVENEWTETPSSVKSGRLVKYLFS